MVKRTRMRSEEDYLYKLISITWKSSFRLLRSCCPVCCHLLLVYLAMRFLTFVLAAIVFGAARSWPHLATSTDGVLTRQLYPRAEEHGATTKVGPSRAGWAEVSEPISFKKQPLDLSEEHTKLSKRSSPLNKLSPKQLEYVKGKVQGLMDELQKQKLGVSGCELVCIAVSSIRACSLYCMLIVHAHAFISCCWALLLQLMTPLIFTSNSG